MDLDQANTKDEEYDDDNDISILDCGVSDMVMNGVEESRRDQGETCFGTVSKLQ